jgi:ParB family chromosome partitioning protein
VVPPSDNVPRVQNSSEFENIAIDTSHESATNPHRTFNEVRLYELAESLRANGFSQPITVRPDNNSFQILAGAKHFRTAACGALFPFRRSRASGPQNIGSLFA